MPLTTIAGGLGTGKTLLLTILASLSKVKVISNYKLNKTKYEPFLLSKFVNSEYDNALLLLDEMYSIMDARTSMSIKNRAVSYILFQSRKKELDIIGTVQLFRTIDLRFRELSDRLIYAYGLVLIRDNLYFKYELIKGTSTKVLYLSYENAKKYFSHFNTQEVILPEDTDNIAEHFKSRDEKIDTVNELAKEIVEYYENEKITKNKVKLYLFEHKKPKHYQDLIYVKAKDLQNKG